MSWTNSDATAAGPQDSKRIQNLRAVLALKGFALSTVNDGETTYFLATRWNMARSLPDLDAIEDFAKAVGAPL